VRSQTQPRLSGDLGVDRLRGRLHAVAFVASVPAAVLLLRRATTPRATWGAAIYAITLVGLYAVSVTYHVPRWNASARAALRRADRSMIYVFIAGVSTPICLLIIRGTLGAVIAIVTWLVAITGVVLTNGYLDRTRALCGALYIVQGWLIVAALPLLIARLDSWELAMLFGGGLLYTAGAGVLARRRPDPVPGVFGYHEVWHTMVVVASGLHYALLWRAL
jgi:hemolysin III